MRKGSKHSEEAKLKVSKANKGKSAGSKNPMFGRSGDKNPNYGKLGEDSQRWNGGVMHCKNGRIMLYSPDHPLTGKNRYVYEHRIVMEKIIGRYLLSTEVIHHINGNGSDNRPENLMLFNNHSEHMEYHQEQNRSLKAVIQNG